jgi:translation initiation factor IF-1
LKGKVTSVAGALFKVELDGGEEITAHVAEEFRRISVAPRPGDRVVVKKSELDPRRGSIVGVEK